VSWSEPTVLGLMRKHRQDDPERAIESYVLDQLAAGRQRSLPVDVDGLASLLGIKQRKDSFPFAGRIYAEPSGQLVMDLDNGYEPRRRFTCAHEIIHTAFPGFQKQARYRSDVTTGSYTVRDEEEYLCDRGAASLLMPATLVAGDYNVASGLDDVEQLSEDADASLEAAGNRLVALADTAALMLVLEVAHKPADRTALRRGKPVEPRLRVRYCASNGVNVFVPRHKSAADDSIFVQALAQRERLTGRTYLPGAEKLGLVEVECKSYPYADRERVIAIVR
jgi:hypothetical protein